MSVERLLRGIAGFFIVASVLLAHFHSPYWLLFTAFVGLNLLQSALTDWCPMMTILRKLGFAPAVCSMPARV
jgi:H+/gluconate symporter-like permease